MTTVFNSPKVSLPGLLTGFSNVQKDDEPTFVLEAVIESTTGLLTEDMLLGAMEDTLADMRDRRIPTMGKIYRMHGTFYLDVLLFLRQANQACGLAYFPKTQTRSSQFPGMRLNTSVHEAHERMAAAMDFHEINNLDDYPDVLHPAARPYNTMELMEMEDE